MKSRAFQAELAIAQHVCNNGSLCGDHCTYFNDGLGRMVMIVSDGMGSGGRAAVDGAMAAGILAKLAKAGISFDCALRIVNSALLVKSGDESLATLDVARVDLFSGKAEFCKAGAAVSYVVRKGKIHRVDLPSLPARNFDGNQLRQGNLSASGGRSASDDIRWRFDGRGCLAGGRTSHLGGSGRGGICPKDCGISQGEKKGRARR